MKSSNPNSIHERLSLLRKSKGLTQSDLARLLGITYQAVQSWEKGDSAPKRIRLEQVARFFGVPLSYLISGELDANHSAPEIQETNPRTLNWNERIRDRLDELELTQTDLAKSIGVTPSRIGNYLQGTREPSLSVLMSIASALDVTTDWILFGGSSQPAPARKTLAKNLKTLMQAHITGTLSQNELSKISGIAQSTIGRILREEIDTTIDTAQALSRALNVECWELLKPENSGKVGRV